MNHDSAEETLLPAEGDVGLFSWYKYFSQFLAHTETFLHGSLSYNKKNHILLRFQDLQLSNSTLSCFIRFAFGSLTCSHSLADSSPLPKTHRQLER